MDTKFPKDFLWGASTASHQVEGGTTNQWSEWETANAEDLSKGAKQRLGYLKRYGRNIDWESIAEAASKPDNYKSGIGVRHFEKYEEDFALLRSLNMNAFRFSIEWSRIEPQAGQWDKSAIAHYHEYIAKLKSLQIEPILTIWHWTMPTWFTSKGGFAKKQNLKYFYDYVAKIADEFVGELDYILILNEPNVYSLMSYTLGTWPPQKKNPALALKVFANLATAHNRAYKIVKAVNPKIKIGSAVNLSQSYAVSSKNPANHFSIKAKDYMANWWFLNRVRKQLDFIGVNFYLTEYFNWRLKFQNPQSPTNDLGWYMEPNALYDLLLETNRRYHLPLIITENGLADASDKYRKWWLEQTIDAMRKALKASIPLKGYLHWSLLDNFEWSSGWWPKFGLVEVDRATMKRSIRHSAKWLASEIKRISH